MVSSNNDNGINPLGDMRPSAMDSPESIQSFAQNAILDSDLLKQRKTLVPDCLGYAERNTNKPIAEDAWFVYGAADPRETDDFEDLMRIITLPGVKGSLVESHIRPVRSKDNSFRTGIPVPDEITMVVVRKIVDKNTAFRREVTTISTNMGRKFTFDRSSPVSWNDKNKGTKVLVYSEGGTLSSAGFTGRMIWNEKSKDWRAERATAGRNDTARLGEVSPGPSPEIPQPYHRIDFTPPEAQQS